MKEYNITLTEREIEVLQISLCETALHLERSTRILKKRNKLGINSKMIKLNQKCKQACDDLWEKIYDKTKII